MKKEKKQKTQEKNSSVRTKRKNVKRFSVYWAKD